MARTTLFRSNRSQAVRLPKSAEFPPSVTRVEVLAIGASRLVVPADRGWAEFFASAPGVSEDFLRERDQPPADRREPL